MPTIEEILLGKPLEDKIEPEEAQEVLKGNLQEEVVGAEEAAEILKATVVTLEKPPCVVVLSEPEYVGKLPSIEESRERLHAGEWDPLIKRAHEELARNEALAKHAMETVAKKAEAQEEVHVEEIGFDDETVEPGAELYRHLTHTLVKKVNSPTKRVVLIDGSNLAMRCFFPLKDMARSDGYPTGLLFGMLKNIRSIKRECNALPILVWDGERGSAQKRAKFAAYKGNRGDNEIKTRCFEQLSEVRELLRCTGIPQVRMDDEEADDVIGSLAYNTYKDDFVFVYSNDNDFLQLVDDSHLIVVKTGKKGTEFYDSEKVEEQMGVSPERVPLYRSLRGDKSDNLPGIHRFPSKVIVKLFNKYADLDALFSDPEQNFADLTDFQRNGISDFEEQARLNLELMTLKRDLEPDLQVTNFNADLLKDLFEDMEFNSFLADFDGWCGEFGPTSGFVKVA